MKALVIVDIQNDYFERGTNPLHNSLVASENARKVLDKFREEKHIVVHIQHIAVRPDATFLLPGTHGADIHPNVKPLDDEKLFVKHYPNSFRETGLLEYLHSMDVSELVICGMMTHMCVDATVRAAKDNGYSCTLIADACATKSLDFHGQKIDAENVHHSFLAALSYFYAQVISTEKFLSN